MKITSVIIDDILHLVFPRVCFGCGDHLTRNEKLICTTCLTVLPARSLFSENGNRVEEMFWGRCKIENAASYALFTRGGVSQRIIHNLKYRGIRELGPFLGAVMGSRFRNLDWVKEIDFICFVPLHRKKEAKRGYNQSRLIAEGFSDATSIPLLPSLLERVSSAATQTTRGRYERWENVASLFRVVSGDLIEDKHLLLIDDVITTGSTIEACVNKLTEIKGVRVSVVSLAATFD